MCLGLTLAADRPRPYIDCYAEVFVPCLEHVLAFRDEGFLISACIPTAGILANHPGYVDSYLMYKQLDTHAVSIGPTFQFSGAAEQGDLGRSPPLLQVGRLISKIAPTFCVPKIFCRALFKDKIPSASGGGALPRLLTRGS